jgi:hypothetical protein
MPESQQKPTILKIRPAGFIIAGVWLGLFAADMTLTLITSPRNVLAVSLLGLAAALLPLAVRRIRQQLQFTDLLYPLILLNPLFAVSFEPFDRTLMGAALLGLLTAAIVAMKRESLPRYVSAVIIMAALALLSRSFLLMLPALILWLLFSGIMMVRPSQKSPGVKTRGFIVLAFAEASIVLFGIACYFEPPLPPLAAADLFATIVSFADFPLTIAGIIALALAFGRSPTNQTPPWLTGLFALLLAMLTLLITNIQSRKLPPPGADQTMILLCILYTIFSLSTPRWTRWSLAILLILAAYTYEILRPYA